MAKQNMRLSFSKDLRHRKYEHSLVTQVRDNQFFVFRIQSDSQRLLESCTFVAWNLPLRRHITVVVIAPHTNEGLARQHAADISRHVCDDQPALRVKLNLVNPDNSRLRSADYRLGLYVPVIGAIEYEKRTLFQAFYILRSNRLVCSEITV